MNLYILITPGSIIMIKSTKTISVILSFLSKPFYLKMLFKSREETNNKLISSYINHNQCYGKKFIKSVMNVKEGVDIIDARSMAL